MAGSIYEGKTFDEAVRKGLEALRLSRAEAVITTIEEGKGGFLGIGARPYRVSVARRPGGAIREPAERDERRGGRRGGAEERPKRGGREAQPHGRGAREERAPRAGRDERGGRGKRDERGGRDEKAGREERPARAARGERAPGAPSEERVAREERPARPPRPGREERPPREERGPREERVAREDLGGREPRGGREERGGRPPRVERHAPPAPVANSVAPPEVSEGGDDSPRKRRRRGRRGGRGRRRGGAGEFEDAPAPMGMNGVDAAPAAMESVEAPAPMHTHMPSPSPFAPVSHSEAVRPVEGESPLTPVEASSESMAPAREEGFGGHRRERRERSRGRERGGEGRESREASGAPDMDTEELMATSRKLTEDLLRAMGFEPKVTVRAEGNRVDVTVEVERDEQLLVGRQGETQQSLQHLLNRFLNKGDGSRYHLQLEVNDFWQQREAELTQMARGMADDAVAKNAEIVSDYLNSQERRIMHMTLREDARVRTFSLGTGMVKRVAVAPASFPDRSEDEGAS